MFAFDGYKVERVHVRRYAGDFNYSQAQQTSSVNFATWRAVSSLVESGDTGQIKKFVSIISAVEFSRLAAEREKHHLFYYDGTGLRPRKK